MGIVYLKTSSIISGDIPLTTLYISVPSACILLWCIETELSLYKSSSKFESLSFYIILKQSSCSLLILLLRYGYETFEQQDNN